jgi:polyisoprenoid-binding protein YceI
MFALVAIVAAAPFAAAAPVTWNVDPVHTETSFQVTHFFSKVRGVFKEMQGTIVYDEADPNAIKVDAQVKVASVDTGNEKRDAHLQTADFFEADKNPTLTFKSTSVKKVADNRYKITGDLTMRGVTKPVTFDAEFLGSSAITMDGKSRGHKAGFAATTVINRKDFGINWNKTMDNGGVVLGENVTITLNVEADKAEPAKAMAEKPQ